MRGEGGFTLLEMVVVVAIIATLLAIATLDFSRMQKKGTTEKEVRQMYSDVENARLQAVYGKKPTAVVFQPGSYTFKRYSSENEDPSAGTTVSSQSVTCQLTFADGSSIAGQSAQFDPRGAAGAVMNILANPAGSDAAVDCLVIDIARTSMGKMQNGTCVIK